MNLRRWSVAAICMFAIHHPSLAQSAMPDGKLAEHAQHEYATGNFADAERDFAELVKRDPSSVSVQVYLGQALFRQEKYAASIPPFEKARDLERAGKKLSLDQHRILVDQLAMAYGISGNMKKAHALLQGAIQQDPQYPLNYYNEACAFAEEGDKGKMLTNLSLAFERKAHVLKGEQLPNPRTDSSFEKYLGDDDFIKLMKRVGYY